jgi:hypothetical protein
MMRNCLMIAAALVSTPALADPISLICNGNSAKDQQVGDFWSSMAGENKVQRVEQMDSVILSITDDGGEAQLPKRMISSYREPLRGNWFKLIEVRQGDDIITGKIRIHGMNKPRFDLNRMTGTIAINGQLATFSGRCEPYDPATVQRKF